MSYLCSVKRNKGSAQAGVILTNKKYKIKNKEFTNNKQQNLQTI